MSYERRTVEFSGTVQGVGFRYGACRAAAGYNITGYVRNLPDGRVECIVEGPDEEIDEFLADLCRRLHGYILRYTQHEQPYSGKYSAFSVRN